MKLFYLVKIFVIFQGNPREMSILLFPGQGSQFVGMGKDLMQYPNVPEMFELASDTLGKALHK
jgi:malonyl CoA-acyl carrier protein transacylase